MIVLDASAVIEMILDTPTGQRVAARVAPPSIGLHAPHLLDIEVLQVLRRYVRAGELGADDCAEVIDDLRALDLQRHAHEPLLDRVWALRDNLTAYDAVYVALADALEATLLTCDGRLAGAPGVTNRVELINADEAGGAPE